MQGYLGEDFPVEKRVLSGGDQLTCERQACAQRHLMDGDTPVDRLQLVEPVSEDWHALMCFLKVNHTDVKLNVKNSRSPYYKDIHYITYAHCGYNEQ